MNRDRRDVDLEFKIASIPLFSGLDHNQQTLIREISYIKEFAKGEVLFMEGQTPDALYIVISGEVKIIRVTSQGKEKILEIMETGDFFGEMGVVEGRKRSAMAQANQNARLLVLEKDDFLRFIKANPEPALKMIIELSRRLRRANYDIENLAFLDVENRLKRLFLRFAGEGRGGMVINRKLTHQELAKFIGTSRETVTRTINKLIENGFIEMKNDRIHLKNIEKW